MKTAVFDLDGTLVDSAPDIQAALNRLMASRGLAAFSRAEVVGMVGDGVPALLRKAFRARGLEPDAAALARFTEDYTAHAAAETRPFPGIPEALAALEAAGWRLAVCTNKPTAAAGELLGALGLLRRFAALGCGDSFPMRKPDPGHVLATIAAAGGTPEASVMIGDHHNDVAAARGAGVPCLFVGWGYGPPAMADGVPIVAEPGLLPAALDRLRP
jgi:phosphoglycolate phosphatase